MYKGVVIGSLGEGYPLLRHHRVPDRFRRLRVLFHSLIPSNSSAPSESLIAPGILGAITPEGIGFRSGEHTGLAISLQGANGFVTSATST